MPKKSVSALSPKTALEQSAFLQSIDLISSEIEKKMGMDDKFHYSSEVYECVLKVIDEHGAFENEKEKSIIINILVALYTQGLFKR